MSEQSASKLLDIEIDGRPLREWEASWKPLAGGFEKQHPELRSVIGLVRAVSNGQTMYISRAIEYGKGGIEKGLQRIRGPEQTGNAGYGAKMIKAHIKDVGLEVLAVGSDVESARLTKILKALMIKYHDPEWNRPHTRRMNQLRASKISCIAIDE